MAQAQAAKRRGRPPKSGGGAISGYGKGVRLVWTDGDVRGTGLLVTQADALFDARVSLPLYDGDWDVLAFVEVDRYDPVSAVAVIQAVIGVGVQIVGDVPVGEFLRLRDIDAADFDDDLVEGVNANV